MIGMDDVIIPSSDVRYQFLNRKSHLIRMSAENDEIFEAPPEERTIFADCTKKHEKKYKFYYY